MKNHMNKNGKKPKVEEDEPFEERESKTENKDERKADVLSPEALKQKNKERKMRSAFWFVVASLSFAVVIYLLETFFLKNKGMGKEVLEVLKVVVYTSMGYLFSKKDKE